MRLCLLLLCLGGCYDPSFKSGMFKCVQSSDCPSSLTCTDGLCGSQDLRGAVVDLAQSQGPFDAAQQQTAACKGGKGTQVGSGGHEVWACPGMFSDQGDQNELCGSGYMVCATGTNVNEATCAKAGGFFLVDAALTFNGSFQCGSDSGAFKDLLGCGSGTTFRTPGGCDGLAGGIACQALGFTRTGWSCSNGFADAKNSNSGDGVLCCKM